MIGEGMEKAVDLAFALVGVNWGCNFHLYETRSRRSIAEPSRIHASNRTAGSPSERKYHRYPYMGISQFTESGSEKLFDLVMYDLLQKFIVSIPNPDQQS